MNRITVEPVHHSHSLLHHYTEAIVAVYENLTVAEEAVRALLEKGVTPSEISVIGDTPREITAARSATQELPAAIVDAQDHRDVALGVGLGGAFGALLGLEVALLAGIGSVFVLGPLAVGAAFLGFWGAIISLGSRHQLDAEAQYRTFLHQGKILVVVHVRDRAEADRIAIDATRPIRTEVFPYELQIRQDEAPAMNGNG